MSLFLHRRHVDDESLLLLLEDELSERDLLRATHHLSACPGCRTRLEHLRACSCGVGRLARPQEVDTGSASRQALAALLAAEGKTRQRSHCHLLLQAAAVVALLAVAVVFREAYFPLQDAMAAYEETGPEPVRALTPGAVREVALTDLCALPDNDLDPVVSPEKQRAVFRAYGLGEKPAKAYQVDYLINPQLGGNDALENLWPEPYHSTVWNASAKDDLETRLHSMVCSGQITLQTAQSDLASDWIGAYKKYFHTGRPVRFQALR